MKLNECCRRKGFEKNIANHLIPQNEYWGLITSTLTTYEVKEISSDGTVRRRVVKDNYFSINDIWNANDIDQIPNFEERLKKYKVSKKIKVRY